MDIQNPFCMHADGKPKHFEASLILKLSRSPAEILLGFFVVDSALSVNFLASVPYRVSILVP